MHAQDSCACTTLLCMHNTLVHALEGPGPKAPEDRAHILLLNTFIFEYLYLLFIYIYIYCLLYRLLLYYYIIILLYYYPVRCAQSRHRAFLLASFFKNFCILRSFLQWNSLDFGRQKSSFSVILGARGPPFRGPGPHFDDFWVCCDFGSVPRRKSHPILKPKPDHSPTFGSAGF